MNRWIWPWLIAAALTALAAHPSPAAAEPPSPADFAAVRLDGAAIHLDGVPDEPAWQHATPITGLTSFDPVEGGPPVAGMTAWIFYDTDALYVAARLELPPGTMRGRLAARERWNGDDFFEVMLDPFHDRRTGYDFAVTPFGVQLDYTIVDDVFSSAWDGVWDSAVARRDDGFSVEIRIPFRTLHLPSASVQDWGVGVGFFSGWKNEYDKWPAMSADRGTIYQQLGVMRGIAGVRPSHDLDVIPTLTTGYGGADTGAGFAWDQVVPMRARDPGVVDLGLDLRYGLTAATNLSLTINPDFSQVEADADQLAYNLRFPVVLDEKRPFFLEGVSTFATPVPLLYTRSIVDPIAGLKLTGRQGRWSFGLLSAYDQLPIDARVADPARPTGFEDVHDDDALVTVGRATRDLGTASHVGVFVADKRVFDRGSRASVARNDVVAVDALATFAEVYTITGQAAGSYVAAGGQGGASWSLAARRHDQHLTAELRSDYVSRGFRAETSDLAGVDVIPSSLAIGYRITTDRDALPYLEPGVDLTTIHEASTGDLLDDGVSPRLSMRLGANTDLALSYRRGQETFVRTFHGLDVAHASLTTFPSNRVSASLDLQVGDQIHYDPADLFLGTLVQGTLGVSLRPLLGVELGLHYTRSRLRRPDGSLADDVALYDARLDASFTGHLSLRLISQLDGDRHQLSDSALLAYQLHPGTEGYLGYQEQDDVGDGARPLDRRLFLKLSYRWQL